MKGFWYNVTFVRGSSRRSYAVSAACIGNAKAAAWCRLEDTEGTREGWSLVMVSELNNQGRGDVAANVEKFEACTPITIYRGEATDLWADGEGGWSGNYNWVRRATVVVPSTASDQTVSRRIKAALGIQGMRKDGWAANELCWRDGCVGAYAEAIS